MTSLNGSSISTIKFYTKDDGTSVPYPGEGKTAAPVAVYLKEVSYTRMTDCEPWDDSNVVYSGTLSVVPGDGCGIMTINLSTPYEYGGGNLLIGIDNTAKESYQVVNFLGTKVNYFAAISGHDNNIDNLNYGLLMDFIPQTTFVPTVIAPPAKPTNVEVSDLLANSATISWKLPADATGSAYQYKKASDTEWGTAVSTESRSITLDGLQRATAYQFRVKTLRGSSTSGWTTVSFTTEKMQITTLTVYENAGNKNQYVPVYGKYADYYQKCEFVIPASQLTDMYGGSISKMTFYMEDSASAAWTGTFQIFLKEVSSTTISAFSGTTGATVVYTGTLDATGSTMDVEFNNSYAYSGGNLLVGVYQTKKGNSKQAYFRGKEVAGASVQGYDSKFDEISATQRNFIPKTTFTYMPLDLLPPTDVAVNYTGGTKATVTWTGTAQTFDIKYNSTTKTGITSPYTLTNLSYETTYSVKVRGRVGSRTSAWSDEITFTTPEQFKRPTDIAASNITFNSADISWTGEADSYNLRYRTLGNVIFSDDFESGMGNWTIIRNDEGNENTDWKQIELGSSYAHSGSHVAQSESWNNYSAYQVDNWLISPRIPLNGILTYWVRDNGTYHDHYDIYVSTEPGIDLDTFTKFYEPGEATDNWTEVTVDLSAYAGQEGYIAFRHQDYDEYLLWIDDVTVAVVDIVGDWNEQNNVTSPHTIDNLDEKTIYQVEIQGVYEGSESGSSAWEGTEFTTLDSNPVPSDFATSMWNSGAVINWTGTGTSYNFRYRTAAKKETLFFDDFENGLGQWDTSYLKGGSNVFYYNSDPNNRFFGFDSDASPQYLVSQPLTITSAATLSFSYCNYYYDESFMVGYSTTGNDLEKDFIWSAETTAANNSWNLYEQALPAGVKYVAIKYTGGYQYLFIDDVEIYVNSTPASEWISQTRAYASGIMNSLATNNAYEYQAQSVRGSRVSNWSDIQSFALLTLQDDADNRCLIRGNTGRLAHVTLDGRTFKKDGNYNMVCLPFDLTIADSPFADATIERLTNYNYNSTTQTLTLTFEDYTPTVIPAGYPFIVKWADGEDWTNPQFSDVIMGSTLDQSVMAKDNIQFVGNFVPMTLNGYKRLYVGSDKSLTWPATNVDIGAFRAYFKLLRDDVKQVIVEFGDGTQMSVSSILGDANGDAKVTITDAVGVVNYILGNPSDNFYRATANVNGDTDGDGNPNISITDAVGIVNIILNGGSTTAPALDAPAADRKTENRIPISEESVKLKTLPTKERIVAREENRELIIEN